MYILIYRYLSIGYVIFVCRSSCLSVRPMGYITRHICLLKRFKKKQGKLSLTQGIELKAIRVMRQRLGSLSH